MREGTWRWIRIWPKAWLLTTVLSLATAAAGVAAVPQPVSPGSEAGITAVSGRCPTFHWTAVEGIEVLELVVYRVLDGEMARAPELVVQQTLPGAAQGWTPSLGLCLEPGGRYAWSIGTQGEWSSARLFEVAAAPSAAEVDDALSVLARYRETSAPQAEALQDSANDDGSTEPRAAQVLPVDSGRQRATGPAPEARPSVDSAHPGALQPGFAPILSASPSLTVEDQIQLGSASDIFKDGAVLLWTDGSNNTGLGENAAANTTGFANTAVGFDALRATNTGSLNTGLGEKALRFNTSGSRNTAVGSGAAYSATAANDNTAAGYHALLFNDASFNTAVGSRALRANTTGDQNSAFGHNALSSNTIGRLNTGLGEDALYANTEGEANTAVGEAALKQNITGNNNTALGNGSLQLNTEGVMNTAVGQSALKGNLTGSMNSAVGRSAILVNTTGSGNSALGQNALYANTTGSDNTAIGTLSMEDNVSGARNVAVGQEALANNVSGVQNIAIGENAGLFTDGSNNIVIGGPGAGSESNTLRIGGGTGTGSKELDKAIIHGISGRTAPSGDAVLVAADGTLGTMVSSRRHKEDIHDMATASEALLRLRPVTFRYKNATADGEKPVQFGLIAEEVAEILPELASYDEQGTPRSVRYHLLSSLLLNELQRQDRRFRATSALFGALMLVATAFALRRSVG